jgi:small subunit ribosomal protein S8
VKWLWLEKSLEFVKQVGKLFKEKEQMTTDPISDFLTRIRNASSAGLKMVEIPSSNTKRAMTQILFDQGYILNFKFEEDNKQGIIKIALKYNISTRVPAITKLQRISKPGLRKYAGSEELPRVLNGLGIAIVSTSKGVITDKEARKLNVGGEVLCYVY